MGSSPVSDTKKSEPMEPDSLQRTFKRGVLVTVSSKWFGKTVTHSTDYLLVSFFSSIGDSVAPIGSHDSRIYS